LIHLIKANTPGVGGSRIAHTFIEQIFFPNAPLNKSPFVPLPAAGRPLIKEEIYPLPSLNKFLQVTKSGFSTSHFKKRT
jgi:hypothetical protein